MFHHLCVQPFSKGPCKRTQHCWPTRRNIVWPNMLRPFAWNHNNVAWSRENVCTRALQSFLSITVPECIASLDDVCMHHATNANNSQHCWYKGPCKRTQQVTTLLRVVGQQCCVRLYGPKSLTVSNYTQQVPTLLWYPGWYHANGRNILGPTMLRFVGQRCCVGLHGP